MRIPSSLPDPDAPQYDELDDRLPGMDLLTAVYSAAQPVLQTLRGVPLQGALPVIDDWSLVDTPSPKVMAIEALVRLPADLQRLHKYLEAGSTREWLNAATSGSVSLAGTIALNFCDLTYLLGRDLYHDAVKPSNFLAACEAMDSGEFVEIDGDALRVTWKAVQERLATEWWKDRNALRQLSFDVAKECEQARRTLAEENARGKKQQEGDGPDLKDGPAAEGVFHYQGESYSVSMRRTWPLLNDLWPTVWGKKKWVGFEALGQRVWKVADTSDSTIKSAVSRLGEWFLDKKLPFETETQNGKARIKFIAPSS